MGKGVLKLDEWRVLKCSRELREGDIFLEYCYSHTQKATRTLKYNDTPIVTKFNLELKKLYFSIYFLGFTVLILSFNLF